MNIKYIVSVVLFFALIVSGCSDDKSADVTSGKEAAADNTASQTPKMFNGSVIGTFDSGGYTYLHISTSYGPVWAAGPITVVKKDDNVSFEGRMLMKNFHAKSMNRDFDEIYFVTGFTVNGEQGGAAPPMAANMGSNMNMGSSMNMGQHMNSSSPHKTSPFKSMPQKPFNKAKNGQTISEILANTDKFRDKNVKIRGRVVKYTSGIMDKNWVHIQDSATQNDLTITTVSSAKIGDILLVEGKLELKKDFGQGFIIDVVVDNAKITVE